MYQIDFLFEGKTISLFCKGKEKIQDIYNKFCIKTLIDRNLIYFLYKGKLINENLALEQLINNCDKEKKKMHILVYSNNENTIKKDKISLVKADQIICPKCGEIAKIKINDYKIKIYGCKNNHNSEDIYLREFENTQMVDESKIICDNCKNITKEQSFNKEFYICTLCKLKLCPL